MSLCQNDLTSVLDICQYLSLKFLTYVINLFFYRDFGFYAPTFFLSLRSVGATARFDSPGNTVPDRFAPALFFSLHYVGATVRFKCPGCRFPIVPHRHFFLSLRSVGAVARFGSPGNTVPGRSAPTFFSFSSFCRCDCPIYLAGLPIPNRAGTFCLLQKVSVYRPPIRPILRAEKSCTPTFRYYSNLFISRLLCYSWISRSYRISMVATCARVALS